MILSSLSLQQFRNYTQANFTFAPNSTIILGRNTAGKTNMLDSIHLLSTGKSFVAEKDEELIRFDHEFMRVKGTIYEEPMEPNETKEPEGEITLEVLVTTEAEMHRAGKRYFVNGVPKRRLDFTTHLPTLLFTPMDLEIISDGPSYRRNFLDQVLEQVDIDYKRSAMTYTKALRQRNALLDQVKETGVRNERQFQYWNELLITQGTYIHQKRQEFIDFINVIDKDIIHCSVAYDHSIISEERLEKYKDAEMGAGVTLVGPHRDDLQIYLQGAKSEKQREARIFGSRGQQRLVILQLKLIQLLYMKQHLSASPLLLLDDIFSELDTNHITLVSEMIGKQQTIITTTHEEFVNATILQTAKMIKLKGINE